MNQSQAPLPRTVKYFGYIAFALLIALPATVLIVRSGAWKMGLSAYALSCLAAAIMLLVALLLLALPHFSSWRKAIALRALCLIPGAILLLSVLANRGDYPAIHDISTDTENPPVFTAAPAQRGSNSNSLEIDELTIESQRSAYPDISTIYSNKSIEQAHQQALTVADQLGWDIYRNDLNAGYIEAVDTTTVMGFKDDIVIRLRTNAQGTIIDLRSVSRVGVSDLGANAARIRNFRERFSHEAE